MNHDTEIDIDIFRNNAPFFVYHLCKPNGDPFYVGKGLKARARSLSPSRRNAHCNKIIKKYGASNIVIKTIPCMSEGEAFRLEVIHIQILRNNGVVLANYTDGGEGVSGRKPTEKQNAGLRKGRGRDRVLSQAAIDAIKQGLTVGRAKITNKKIAAWNNIGSIGAIELHKERTVKCIQCGIEFITTSAKARNCSRLCEQRNRRARDTVTK